MPVYIIRQGDDGPVKIGWANDVEARRKQLQVSHHEPLRVIRTIEGNLATERWLHEQFAAQRLEGEWFEFHPEMVGIEPPLLGPAIPKRPKRLLKRTQPAQRLVSEPVGRSWWDICWAGDPCDQCRWYPTTSPWREFPKFAPYLPKAAEQ